jgi:putative membrane protein
MMTPLLKKNDAKAKAFILTVSVIVFGAVAFLTQVKLEVDLPFDVHIFATANAVINSMVAFLLIGGLAFAKQKRFIAHRQLMMTAIILSVFFLLSYIAHHLLAGETKFGDLDHNGLLSEEEKSMAGSMRIVYYIILFTHIPLAGIILPFILFTAYRALIGEYDRHKKLARITWPIWFYVAVTGVIVYLMINPYYA